MSSIPSNLARVPNALLSSVTMSTLNRTSGELLNAQLQLTTGRLVNRPSDNAVSASTISVLDDIIERRSQRLRNLDHGEAMLNNLDSALADAGDALLEAKSLALSQIGFGADPETRANQAIVIDSILQNLTSIANRDFQGIHYFGGTRTAESPMQELLGGLRYGGTNDGLRIDDGQSLSIPITLSADRAFGALSSRVSGAVDLDPGLTPDTRIEHLNGARGLGVTLGSVVATVGGTDLSIDLSNLHTIQDLMDELQTQLQTLDPAASVPQAQPRRPTWALHLPLLPPVVPDAMSTLALQK
jgi:flagellin-like hook-associated protein FlgL